ncbi:MAG TPA: hypothetical protein VNA15_10690 [Candidatus Angelobacter sp.]|nr:hypothetical protein [Candidatus Angelobacter sp.]
MQVYVNYHDSFTKRKIITSDGVAARTTSCSFILRTRVFVKNTAIAASACDVIGTTRGWNDLIRQDIEKYANNVASRARDSARAPRRAKQGKMTVVLDPLLGGAFIRETIGHLAEADTFQVSKANVRLLNSKVALTY